MILRAEYDAKYWKDIFMWETHWPVKETRIFVRDLGELSHMRPARSEKKSLYSLQSNGRKRKIVWEGSVTSVLKIFSTFLPKPYLTLTFPCFLKFLFYKSSWRGKSVQFFRGMRYCTHNKQLSGEGFVVSGMIKVESRRPRLLTPSETLII